MRIATVLGIAALGALVFAASPVFASPADPGLARKLNAALGGMLDSELGEAGDYVKRPEFSQVTLRAGRSDEYRRRVALEKQASVRQVTTYAN